MISDREWALRRLAADLDVPPEVAEMVDNGYAAAVRSAQQERRDLLGVVAAAVPDIAEDITRDFLRPALRAAGFDGDAADRYEVSYVREPVPGHAFRPGVFEQEGDGRCGWQVPCVPWPKADDGPRVGGS